MTALAYQLALDFCKEQRLTIIIFDDFRAAKNYTPSIEKTQPQTRIRGLFELDHGTGKFEINFSTEPGKPPDEIKVNIRMPALINNNSSP
jgi:hypothetical protein